MADRCDVVLIRSGGLGDFVLTLPLLRALHRAGRRVRLFTRPEYGALARPTGWVSALHCVEGSGLDRLWRGDRSDAAAERLGAWLEGAELLTFWSDPSGSLEARVRQYGGRGVRALTPRPSRPPHVSLRMLAEAGLATEPGSLDQSLLGAGNTGSESAPERLWLHPGSGSPAKNAPLPHFVALARAWRGPVAVSLGQAECERLDEYRNAFAPTGAELCLLPTLAELCAGMRRADVFVGNDSGPTHLAAALGVRTFALFVSTDPEIWRPVGARVRIAHDPSSQRREVERSFR